MRPLPTTMAAKVMGAAELFAERGLDGAKMSDIAAATGIPRATLYYHFEGKEAVFAYMCTVIQDAFEEAVAAALNGPGNAAERLSRVVRAQIDIYAAHPMAMQAFQLDLGRAARYPELMQRVKRNYLRPVAELLAEGAADGSMRKIAQPRAVASAILGSMLFAAEQSLSSIDEAAVADLHEAMMSLILQGVEPLPAES